MSELKHTKIATITLNPAYDLVGRLNTMEKGNVNSLENLGLHPAGKGINVAKVLQSLGLKISVSGFLGKDNQAEFEQLFHNLELDDQFCRVDGKTRINVKVTESQDGEVTDLNFAGFTVSPENWQEFCNRSLALAKQMDIVAVCGSLPQGVQLEQFALWLAQLNEQGCKIVLDTSNDTLTTGLQSKPWLVKPNEHELASWAGKPLNSVDNIIAVAKQLRASGVANIIVSMGAEGALWVSKEGILRATPPKVRHIVSTVGAGDSMVAGLIYGLSQDLGQEQTLAFATAISAYAVGQSDVGIHNKDELDALLKQVNITRIEQQQLHIYLDITAKLGLASCHLLKQHLQQSLGLEHQFVDQPEHADLALIFGESLPNEPRLQGKKVYLAPIQQAFSDPKALLKQAQTQGQDYVLAHLQETLQKTADKEAITGRNIVAITACPTGVAHTFMAAEALENYAKQQGWNIKVETRGQVGVGNPLSKSDIDAADLVFVAADIDVDLSQFNGKPMYRTSTGAALKKTAQEFDNAFNQAQQHQYTQTQEHTNGNSTEKKGFYKHLMTGVSHMLPLVVAGGLLIAISFMFGYDAFTTDAYHGLPKALMDIGGGAAFHLMIAIFSGYVAYSIADRPGLAVGLVGGMVATTAGAGILGGIIAGFFAGYVVKGLNYLIRLPASLTSLKPILILPLLGSLIIGLVMIYVINPPVAQIMTTLADWLQSMGEVNAVILGLIIGGMMCIDMGGPVNKAAYTFSVGLIASHVYAPMAAVMAAGMVPPIGMAIATWFARRKFTTNQRDAAKASFVLGLCFISEGALPFVAADPIRVIISSVIGGAIAGGISMGMGILLQAPHGGLFVIPFVSQPLMYIGAIAAGSLVTGILYAIIKPKLATQD